MESALASRYVYERAVRDAQTIPEPKKVKPRETAADRRNFYRKQAGWPVLKEKTDA